MRDDDLQRAKHLAALSPEDLGRSEEEVKINFVVPLLELLGHSRLRFEYKNKDILLRESLPAGATVVVETKRAGEPLDRHLDQLANPQTFFELAGVLGAEALASGQAA